MTRPTLEIAVDTVRDGLLAAEAGADRLELCADLAAHGFTPPLPLLRDTLEATGLPVLALLRARGPGFAAAPGGLAALLHAGEELLAAGAAGLVFGVLDAAGGIDTRAVTQLVRLASERATVFHRAFDLLPDPAAAAAQLADLGVRRVLSAGQTPPEAGRDLLGEPHAGPASPPAARAARLRALVALGAVEVVACGGIRAGNAAEIVRGTGCRQVHSAARRAGRLDAAEVRALRAALDAGR